MTPRKKFLALRADSKFTPGGQEIDLAKIFSYRYHRKVNRDNTLRFNGMVYQLKRKPYVCSCSGKKAEIRYLPDVFLSIYIDNELVEYRKLLTDTRYGYDLIKSVSDTKNRLKSRNNDYEKVAIL